MSDAAETLPALQERLSRKYAGGTFGAVISGMVWAIAGVIAARSGIASGFVALFFGGMVIFPLSALASKPFAKGPADTTPNPLERLALEGTAMLFASLFIGWLLIKTAPGLVFPTVSAAVGVRYLTFRTLYGDPVYWGLGLAIAVASMAAALGHLSAATFPIIVGVIEIVFAGLIFVRWRRTA